MSAPAPGVGCGAAIVREGPILLVKRLKAPEPGHWNLSGGKVDFLGRVEDAVVRKARGLRQEVANPDLADKRIDIRCRGFGRAGDDRRLRQHRERQREANLRRAAAPPNDDGGDKGIAPGISTSRRPHPRAAK